MYSPKISEDQVNRLYRLKISRQAAGEKGVTMTGLVREALEKYLNSEEMKIKVNKDRVYYITEPTEKEIKEDELETQIRENNKRLSKKIYVMR